MGRITVGNKHRSLTTLFHDGLLGNKDSILASRRLNLDPGEGAWLETGAGSLQLNRDFYGSSSIIDDRADSQDAALGDPFLIHPQTHHSGLLWSDLPCLALRQMHIGVERRERGQPKQRVQIANGLAQFNGPMRDVAAKRCLNASVSKVQLRLRNLTVELLDPVRDFFGLRLGYALVMFQLSELIAELGNLFLADQSLVEAV